MNLIEYLVITLSASFAFGIVYKSGKVFFLYFCYCLFFGFLKYVIKFSQDIIACFFVWSIFIIVGWIVHKNGVSGDKREKEHDFQKFKWECFPPSKGKMIQEIRNLMRDFQLKAWPMINGGVPEIPLIHSIDMALSSYCNISFERYSAPGGVFAEWQSVRRVDDQLQRLVDSVHYFIDVHSEKWLVIHDAIRVGVVVVQSCLRNLESDEGKADLIVLEKNLASARDGMFKMISEGWLSDKPRFEAEMDRLESLVDSFQVKLTLTNN